MDRAEWLKKAKRGVVYAEWPFATLPWLAGQDGFTPGPMTFIRPRSRNDDSLHVHEYQHRVQFGRNPIRYAAYVASKRVRYELEVDAYGAQLAWFAKEIWPIRVVGYSENLARNYGLDKSAGECRDAILEKASAFVPPTDNVNVPPVGDWRSLVWRFRNLR